MEDSLPLGSQQRHARSLQAVNLGLVTNVLLAALKVSIGIIANSPALLADGVNSTSDVAYYVVVRIFMSLSRKPPDREHPFGHNQLESIAALIVGSFVITTAVAIFWDAINQVYELFSGRGGFGGAAPIALGVALLTISIKIGLMIFTRRVGKQTRNAAVLALAYDHRNDVFSATATAVGIFLGRSGLPWLDPLAGALVAILILRTGVSILREASADLMDNVPSEALAQEISQLLADVPGVECVEEVYAHRFGPYLVANVTIGIDGNLSVAAGDSIASKAEATLIENVDLLRRVHVHYHPSGPGRSSGRSIQSLSSLDVSP